MKKLEDIPKKNIFEVPEGYFDRLPGIIQARVSQPSPVQGWRPSWSVSLRYALPVVLMMTVGVFWYTHNSQTGAEKIQSELAGLSSDQLVEYLDEHEVGTDDLVERIAWSADDLNDLENSVYSDLDVPHKDIDKILNEYDVEL